MKKKIPAFLLGLLLLGCSDGRDGRVVFSVGGAPAELAAWEELVENFEKETGIAVELLRQPANTDQQRQNLVIALQARRSNPDVFLMDVAWVGLFVGSGWLEPLPDIDRGPFFQKVLDLVDVHDGRLLALPVYLDGGVLYYRRDLLKGFDIGGPPRTWEDLLFSSCTVQRILRRKNPDFFGFVWQGAQYEGLITDFLEFAGSRGGFVLKDGKILLDIPENRRALEYMHDLVWKYQVSPPNTYTEMREEQARLYFQEGNALFERNWPYAWSLHQEKGSKVRGRTGIAPLPAWPGDRSTSTLGGWHIGVSRFSDLKPQALAFVRYVTSRRGQKRMVLALGWNPGRDDLYSDPEVLEQMPYLPELEKVFKNARPRPAVPYYSQISEIAQRRINGALAGKYSPEQALQGAQKEISALVKRYDIE